MKDIKFKRRQSFIKKLRDGWRKPKGLQNKLRLRKKGKGKVPKIGYGTKKSERVVVVKNLSDLNKDNEKIIISSKIGIKKKIEIIKKAEELKLKMLNLKDPKEFLEQVKKDKSEKKKLDEEKKKKREKRVSKKEEKRETKDDKEKKEKEEKKKVLEKGL